MKNALDMDYTLIRSKRKTIALEVTRDAQVIVRAPQRLPQRDIDGFVARHARWLEEKLAGRKAYLETHPEPTQAHIETLRAAARAYIPVRVSFYAGIMGLRPSAVKITAARTRFGSCSPKNSLNFSCFLMEYPEEAIDYVVVHELAHIRHKNHGPDFYRLVACVLPDYRRRRVLLKKGYL